MLRSLEFDNRFLAALRGDPSTAPGVREVDAFWSRVRLGLIILTTPRRYFRTVVPLQLAGWCCRIGAMYWFLLAFHVPAGVVDAALALSAQSASTLLPFTPGGLGTQQALLGYMFRNAAATSTVLAFSVGMQVMVTLTTAVAGGIAIWITLRRLPWRAHRQASAAADAQQGKPGQDRPQGGGNAVATGEQAKR